MSERSMEKSPISAPVRTLLILAAMALVLSALKMASGLFLPFVAGLFLTAVNAPIVDWLQRRVRLPRPLAVTTGVLGTVTVMVGLGAVLGFSFQSVIDAIPRYRELGTASLPRLKTSLAQWGIPVSSLSFENAGGALTSLLATFTQQASQFVANTVLVLLMLGFFLAELPSLKRKLSGLNPRGNPYTHSLAKGLSDVQRYLILKTVVSVATGAISGLWWAAWGVDFALFWAIFTFAVNFIPSIGPAISFAPPTLIALLTLGPVPALVGGAGHLVIGFLIGNLVEPPLYGKRLQLATLAVFLGMFAWGWLWGPVGALFAVPLTLLLRNFLAVHPDTRPVAVLLGSEDFRPPGPGPLGNELSRKVA